MMREVLIAATWPVIRLLSFLGVDGLLSVFVALALVAVVALALVDCVLRLAARRSVAAVGVRNLALAAVAFGVAWLVGGAWKAGGAAGAVVPVVAVAVLLVGARVLSSWLLRFYDKRQAAARG